MSLDLQYIIIMSKVVVVKYSEQRDNFLNRRQYQELLAHGLKGLSGQSDYSPYLRRLFPKGAVGMKTNCLTRFNPTPKSLADSLSEMIIKATERNANDVIVWERTNRELKSAGYELNASSFGQRCLGTDTDNLGYSREFYGSGRVNSLVSRILTEKIKHSINLPILKDHSIAGLSGGLKNMYGAINNPNKYHGNHCDPHAANVNNLEPIRSSHRLTIIDAIRVQYDNGPGFDRNSLAYYNGLIFSEDPVAADRVALEILSHMRKKYNRPALRELGRPADYLKSATKIGLGESDLNQIDLHVSVVTSDNSVVTGELL